MTSEYAKFLDPVDVESLPIIYFVLPCYNEVEGLEHTAEVLHQKISQLVAASKISEQSRILFVDDGSKDGTWELIEKLHNMNGSLFGGVKLAHNRGHQNALYAGLMEAYKAGCDAAISMDADLQDDVNAADEMIKQFSEHHCEIVYGVRSSREKDTWFKRNTAELFYSIFAWMGAETVPNHADYRLMGRASLEALSEYNEVNLFLRGIVPTLGFKTGKVYYERGVRKAGESKYPLKKMIAFAIEGITSFSTKPLKLVTSIGVLSILVGLAMLVYVIASVFTNHAVVGWGSMMCSLWLIGGFLMLSLGIVGEYVGKIYLESKRRPRYCIETKF
ncbi:glycosyltransferase family 2 protein [Bifidobacterium pseudocatenulatum]|uniref:glycosyltransferase family 2 protein n=2 Tax=Bifidobacterium pseudocatenulatum TaxID=28026 RepID=UPI001CFB90C8|nr:glycosyltransferase family 2 protein [Bifidobacterium pseudocatenulatum]MCB4915016.1 glycosyltransferase family 2 protein [Bifidobacterium pseudocatenulatum]UDG89918.1 glycosyltransferase family 2 protein [Bifidobacterium pseudocatenulatum]